MDSVESIEKNKKFEKFELSLGGHALTISSDQDQAKMDLIVKLANNKLSQSLNKNYSFQKSLMIALLSMCEESINYKSKIYKKVENLEDKAEVLLTKFHKALPK